MYQQGHFRLPQALGQPGKPTSVVEVTVRKDDRLYLLRVELQSVHVLDESVGGEASVEEQPVSLAAHLDRDEGRESVLCPEALHGLGRIDERVVDSAHPRVPAHLFLAGKKGIDLVIDERCDLKGVGFEEWQGRHALLRWKVVPASYPWNGSDRPFRPPLIHSNPMKRAESRPVRAGTTTIGGGNPFVVQSMCATRTQDIEATVAQASMLHGAGAGLVRIAVDSVKDVAALAEVRARVPEANLVVDLQENYRLAAQVAPHVAKIRYNPGHLYHHEKGRPVRDKVASIAETATRHDCALRIGVNCGSVDPEMAARFDGADPRELAGVTAMVESALEHCRYLDDLGFERYVVSMKDSDPRKVIEGNRRFAAARPDVPLHLGVTEAGMLPDGVIKTRIAFEQLLSQGIGDTLRVSLTLPFAEKWREVDAGRQIIADVEAGRFRSVPEFLAHGLNIISCPSCSRVENEAFVDLAFKVREMAQFARDFDITIAVMGCRVNGPGETDDADLGLWCGPAAVNLKRGGETVGAFPYDAVLDRLKDELDTLIARKGQPAAR